MVWGCHTQVRSRNRVGMTKAGANDPQTGKSESRDRRLAEALRENLRRRKAQARGRNSPPQGPAVKGGKSGQA